MATKKNGSFELRGVEFEGIDDSVFNDLDLLDMVDDIVDGNVLKIKKVLKKMLGDQWSKAYEAIRGGDGVARADDAAEFLAELFEAVGAKNS